MKNLNKMTLAEMQAEIVSKSKTLNSRLSRLEKYYQTADDPAGEAFVKIQQIGGYAESINRNWRTQQPRFSTAKPKTIQEARRVLKQVRKAYNVKGGTQTAIEKGYEAQARALTALYRSKDPLYKDITLTKADIKLFHAVMAGKDSGKATSNTVIRVILEMNRAEQLGIDTPMKKTPTEIINYINRTNFPDDALHDYIDKGNRKLK